VIGQREAGAKIGNIEPRRQTAHFCDRGFSYVMAARMYDRGAVDLGEGRMHRFGSVIDGVVFDGSKLERSLRCEKSASICRSDAVMRGFD
jgi:hypothetical protein